MNDWFEWRDAPTADYAVIGDPVSHSLSPRMHTAAYRALGMDARYVALRVTVPEFEQAIGHLADKGYKGANVTVPLKEAAYAWVQSPTDPVRSLGAVNTVALSLHAGTNTDVTGLDDVLASLDRPVERALVLGAGGTARAFLVHLLSKGLQVRAWNRTEEKLRSLQIEGLETFSTADPTGCDVVINATSASMTAENLPVEWQKAPKHCVAIDCFYTKGKTVFQQEAEAYGLATIDGRLLLVAQGARSFEWWTGMTAPREAMLSAINED